jgi:hypothetical protein
MIDVLLVDCCCAVELVRKKVCEGYIQYHLHRKWKFSACVPLSGSGRPALAFNAILVTRYLRRTLPSALALTWQRGVMTQLNSVLSRNSERNPLMKTLTAGQQITKL